MRARRRDQLAVALFAAQIAVLDAGFRGLGAYVERPRLLLGLVASSALLVLAATFARKSAARLAVAALTGASVMVECVYFRYYHDALDAQAIASAVHNWSDVRAVVTPMIPRLALLAALSAALEWCLLGWAARAVPPRRAPGLVLAASLAIGPSPNAGASALFRRRARTEATEATLRGPIDVPPLPKAREELPSVVLVLTESVRAASYDASVAPEVHALLADRIEMPEMRAVASYTAVSFSALVTGRSQEGSREAILKAPTVFELLHAVRSRGRRVTVAYWSAQSESVFERDDARASIDSFVTVETLVGHAIADEDEVVDQGVDRLLAAHAARELPKLPRPFFLVLHFAGTHAPYFVDDARAPFRPYQREVTWSGMPMLYNAYKNAIFEQDLSISRSLAAFFDAARGAPHAVLFTSDHGEAFGEHGAIHHGQNLYDEQIHVPAWLVARDGALSPAEIARARTNGGGWLTHLDLLPTLLDLYGVWGGVSLPGRSLLAAADVPRAPVPITNCTAMFPCPINTWGLLFEGRALEAQRWDADWKCVDLRARGGANAADDDPTCRLLRGASRASFPELPNRRPNL